MPLAAKRRCAEPGCTELVERGRCAKHKRTNEARQYDKGRKEDIAFYKSARWRKLRALVLSKEPLCQLCMRYGRTTEATEVHHLKARKAHPELAMVESNLEGLCTSCHSTMENQERRQSK